MLCLKRHTARTVLILFLLTGGICLHAQGLVRAGLQLGGNLSQLDGDSFEGFHKLGLRFGLRAEVAIRPKIDLVLELNYEDKGSYFGSHPAENKDRNKTVKLEYAEIPILLRISPWDHIPIFGEFGASVAYLWRDRFLMEENDPYRLDPIADRNLYRRSEINLLAGFGTQITQRLSLIFRYSYGIQALVRDREGLTEYLQAIDTQDPAVTTVPVFHLRNYQMSIGVAYVLFGGDAQLPGQRCPSVF
ncbi:MAG: PorT family protein [Saprospiraceae bacterium]|nr:PorT family protein [Saprospiraceae bacterium]